MFPVQPCRKECPTPAGIAAECQSRSPQHRPIRVAVAGTTCTDHSAMGFLALTNYVLWFSAPVLLTLPTSGTS